ncbi:MAG: hypothetical protein EON91_07285 [Brevundimonas sp.]|uniref:hypothetical protein n=1 Tax=Brevundimonas sp. TaxID=1871086 RepID=UPI00120BE767|nr:hypothetical protein [Brevundimonas sp.]RZJ17932.1 MAG: hypothetical protein EON91_07285 [Brevundimonas sp.]
MNVAALFASLSTPGSAPAATGGAITRGDKATERDKAKLDEARAALQALKSRPPTQAAEERKALARKKVDQLKARIRMLQMSASMDPKATARMAAQLARELGAAVKAYASAGGSTAELGLASAGAAPATGEAGAQGAQGDADNAPADGEAADAITPAATTDPTTPDTTGNGRAEDGKTSADPYRRLIDEGNARSAALAKRNSESDADREFLTQAKGLANALKAALRQAQNRQDTEDLSPAERQAADKASADMDREIAEAGASLNPGVFVTA